VRLPFPPFHELTTHSRVKVIPSFLRWQLFRHNSISVNFDRRERDVLFYTFSSVSSAWTGKRPAFFTLLLSPPKPHSWSRCSPFFSKFPLLPILLFTVPPPPLSCKSETIFSLPPRPPPHPFPCVHYRVRVDYLFSIFFCRYEEFFDSPPRHSLPLSIA